MLLVLSYTSAFHSRGGSGSMELESLAVLSRGRSIHHGLHFIRVMCNYTWAPVNLSLPPLSSPPLSLLSPPLSHLPPSLSRSLSLSSIARTIYLSLTTRTHRSSLHHSHLAWWFQRTPMIVVIQRAPSNLQLMPAITCSISLPTSRDSVVRFQSTPLSVSGVCVCVCVCVCV